MFLGTSLIEFGGVMEKRSICLTATQEVQISDDFGGSGFRALGVSVTA